jgi:mono/diheme cytochrome c family protein
MTYRIGGRQYIVIAVSGGNYSGEYNRVRAALHGPRHERHAVMHAKAAALFLAVVALKAAEGPSVWDGVYTAEQARRGETSYLQACASCHGPALDGGDMTRAARRRRLHVELERPHRRRSVRPHPHHHAARQPGRLSRPQTADVIAFVLKANSWPAGATELPPILPP